MTKEILSKDIIIPDFNMLFPDIDDESYLLASIKRSDYSASRIACAVEDCNAQLLNLNVTTISSGDNDDVVVSLRVNLRNPEPVVRSLSRYGYEVLSAVAVNEADADTMRSRANELLRYLEV